ncbi:MAG: hypothetical protein ATN35_02980 [Epulopiscium sp. Nele67-Bin004]|nr:MAG: hypothetical protein ATN35_02980 [Epulopiscium sp. Nele67-Bin004]
MQINNDIAQASQQSTPKQQTQQPSIDVEIKQPQQQAQPVKTSNSGQDNSGSGSGSEQSEKQDAIVKAASKEISSDSGSVDLKFTSLRFSVHERTNRVAVQIVDKASDQVIKEIPSEEVLDMLGKMWDAAGIFVDVQR